MTTLLRSRISLVWFVLVGATLLSWEMGHGIGLSNARHAGVVILILAFIKVRLVLLDFMELRHAPLPMRLVGEAWAAVLGTCLVALFWMAPVGVAG